MILTDGVTTFTHTRGVDNDPELVLEKSFSTTSGGLKRSQVSGKRYVDELTLRLTESEYRDLLDLMDQPSASYDYTPDTDLIPDFLSGSDFPMNVMLDIPKKQKRTWNGQVYIYVTLGISSVDFIT